MKSQRWHEMKHLPTIGFIGLLVSAYAVYLIYELPNYWQSYVHNTASITIVPFTEPQNSSTELSYWTQAAMSSAESVDTTVNQNSLIQGNESRATENKVEVAGTLPSNGKYHYPQSTVGKMFFTSNGSNYVCSGTAIVSGNKNSVDTAGHCLYWNKVWSQNVIFCPLYLNGPAAIGCWAATTLFVPQDWRDEGSLSDLHHDFGMFVVSPNDEGNLTDIVGGAGYASGQAGTQTYYAYGYPAADPFDGELQHFCVGASTFWADHAGGTVISIVCDMNGGSSGGAWFYGKNGNWYLNGHNDFGSPIAPDSVFSPYYDDTWYALYQRGENAR